MCVVAGRCVASIYHVDLLPMPGKLALLVPLAVEHEELSSLLEGHRLDLHPPHNLDVPGPQTKQARGGRPAWLRPERLMGRGSPEPEAARGALRLMREGPLEGALAEGWARGLRHAGVPFGRVVAHAYPRLLVGRGHLAPLQHLSDGPLPGSGEGSGSGWDHGWDQAWARVR